MSEETIDKRKAEMLLAVVIDNLYIRMLPNFVDYQEKTHKLGFFKELVKRDFHTSLKHSNQILYAGKKDKN